MRRWRQNENGEESPLCVCYGQETEHANRMAFVRLGAGVGNKVAWWIGASLHHT